jgi:hypothetical protein
MPNPALLFNEFRTFAEEIGRMKQAESPSGVGETSHPVMDKDDSTQDATTGARAEENTKDVKKDVPGTAVDEASAPSPTASEQDSVQPNIGTQQSETGGDPSVEDDYKSTKEDPGTSHPAKADDGEKYAGWQYDKLSRHVEKLANGLLADIIVEGRDKSAAPTPAPVPAKLAAAAGYIDAALAGDDNARAALTVEGTIKEAHDMAGLVAKYAFELAEYYKRAEEGEEQPKPDEQGEPDGDEGSPVATEGEVPAPDAGGGVPGGGGAEATLSSLLGQPEAPPSHDEAMAGVNGAMDDLQISPEILMQIAQLLQQQGAGGPAGPAGPGGPGGPGAPPVPADPAAMKTAALIQKVAREARAFRLDGKYEIGPPKTARAKRIRAEMRNYMSELTRNYYDK